MKSFFDLLFGLFLLTLAIKPDLLVSKELQAKKDSEEKYFKIYKSWKLKLTLMMGFMACGFIVFGLLGFAGIR